MFYNIYWLYFATN